MPKLDEFWTAEDANRLLRGKKVKAITRLDSTAICIDFGRDGVLEIYAALEQERRATEEEAQVLEDLDVGAKAVIDLR